MAKDVIYYSEQPDHYYSHKITGNSRRDVALNSGKNIKSAANAGKLAYDQFNQMYKEAGLENIPVLNYIKDLYTLGVITSDEYAAASYLTNYQNGNFYPFASNAKAHLDTARLLEKMAANVDLYDNFEAGLLELKEGADKALAGIPDIMKPEYNIIDSGPLESFPIGERKLWTGAELAELNDTNWDPEHYYNLIKQGTSAALNEARFLQAQADAASTINNTAEGASYLDALRNIKSEAISAGATRGARAAAEILQANEATNNFATTQRELAANSDQAIREPLLADAQARLTAREYFNSLAQDRYQQAMTYYTNDTAAVGQQILTDAELWGADLNARAQAYYANAQMNRAYNEAQAGVNASKAALGNSVNELAQLLGYYNEASNDPKKTQSDLFNYVFNTYTNGNSFIDLLNNSK